MVTSEITANWHKDHLMYCEKRTIGMDTNIIVSALLLPEGTAFEFAGLKDFYIRKISLHNYRRFEEKTIYLNKSMNLLVGKNSSGKTTVFRSC